ncbi:hypothetical protein SETIT_1G322300v2 [Setaria italica]|uniref:FAF domain-containing protein n=1 Tax=Setaria italica TaxID=4555 RepID=K3YYH4_SETIT|nr:hypothetical protein SETIT_1G322300v2 [Setaria italica]
MLLPPPSAPHSAAQRFSAPAAAGLRSLLLPPDGVVTRAAAAAVASRGDAGARCCRSGGSGEDVVEASGGGTSTGHCEGTKNAKDEEEEDVKGRDAAKEKEAGIIISAEEDEEQDGFWVSYGRRRPRRRLPPPIPSLVARGALRRTRTGDGRLVIRIVPVVRPECIRARRRRGGDRLTMRLVGHEDDSPMMAPPLRVPGGARQDGSSVIGIAREGGDTATPAGGDGGVDDVEEAVVAPEPETMVPAVPPPRVSSVGCFEDVFRFDPIGTGSLHQMPSLRMVH